MIALQRLIVVCLFALTLLLGCGDEKANLVKHQQDILKDQDIIFKAYLESDTELARQMLEKMIEETSKETILTNAGVHFEHGWFVDYCRLYVLEKRAGNEDRAEAALIKAHYWLLIDGEKVKMPVREVMTQVKSFDSERIFAMVDKLDKAATSGKGPMYLQKINERKMKEQNAVPISPNKP